MSYYSSSELPVVTDNLQANLGASSDGLYSLGGQDGKMEFRVDWDNITEYTDTLGNVSYTFSVIEDDNDPFVFRNIVIRKYSESSFTEPLLFTYSMSDSFKQKYLNTGSIHGFEGTVIKQRITGNYSRGLNSANLENQRSTLVTDNPDCPDSETTVGPGGGTSSGNGGGGSSDHLPDYPDDMGGSYEICESEWIDFEDSESCDTGNEYDYCVTASRSILVTTCYTIQYSSGGREDDLGCDEGEIAVNGPLLDPCLGNPLKDMNVTSSGVSGKRGGTFGYTRSGGTQFHDGLDLTATPGTPFYPMQAGTVIHVRNTFDIGEYKLDSYGNRVIIRTTLPDGSVLDLHYNHLDETFVQVGQVIDLNTVIGRTGQTGNAAKEGVTPHLHIKARLTVGGVTVPMTDPRNNPANYMKNVVVLDNGETLQLPCLQ